MASSARLHRAVCGKTIVVTGSSDGIGAHLAGRLGAAGARVILVARTEERLKQVGDAIRAKGGNAHEYVANIAKHEDCDEVVAKILADHGHVDVFVSNAGRSIRRSVNFQASERFHDFERLMALNYFGALRLIVGVLPRMMERGSGHIVHISSFGVPTQQPRFAGYSASKGALDAALQSIAGEVHGRGVYTSSVYMPLVATKMVQSNGHSYDHIPMLTLDMACGFIEDAIVNKQGTVMDAPTRFLALLHFFKPSVLLALNSLMYRLESEAPPDDLPARKPTTGLTKKAAWHARFLLNALGNLLWFFSRVEMVVKCFDVSSILRDLVIFLLLALVILVDSLCLAACSSYCFARRGGCSRRVRAARKALAHSRWCAVESPSCSATLIRSSSLPSAASSSESPAEGDIQPLRRRSSTLPQRRATHEPDAGAGDLGRRAAARLARAAARSASAS